VPEVQGPDEGTEGTHLSQAAKVDMPPVRQDQDAEASFGCFAPSFLKAMVVPNRAFPAAFSFSGGRRRGAGRASIRAESRLFPDFLGIL
jgi:hypothetical protein